MSLLARFHVTGTIQAEYRCFPFGTGAPDFGRADRKCPCRIGIILIWVAGARLLDSVLVTSPRGTNDTVLVITTAVPGASETPILGGALSSRAGESRR